MCGSPRPHVAKALRFIADRVKPDLRVNRIARGVGVHRRTLERAFQRCLGRGISEQVCRLRLEKARSMLLHTNLPIADIAAALSFCSAYYFCHVFKTSCGLTPAQYRRVHNYHPCALDQTAAPSA